jgi:hypothetical protein
VEHRDTTGTGSLKTNYMTAQPASLGYGDIWNPLAEGELHDSPASIAGIAKHD